jgi:hypothetical protein
MIDSPGYIVLVTIGTVLLFFIAYYWNRYVFSIKRQLWNQRMTVFLLAKIAEKSGAINDKQAEEIIRKLSVKDEHLD